jgi:hypothetical protein
MLWHKPRWKREAEQRIDKLLKLLVAQQIGEAKESRTKYLEERWKRPTLNMLASSVPAGRWFRGAQYVIIFGTLAIPIVASWNVADQSPPTFIRVAILAVSLVVAGATALIEALRFRQNFEQNWHTASELEKAGWACVLGVSSEYEGTEPTERFPTFVQHVEALLSDWSVLAGTTETSAPSSETKETARPRAPTDI